MYSQNWEEGPMKVQLDEGEVRVRFKHAPLPFGGYITACRLIDTNGDTLGVGVAKCVPEDNFCKATGRKLSLTRALAKWPKDLRQQIWECYFYEHSDRKTN